MNFESKLAQAVREMMLNPEFLSISSKISGRIFWVKKSADSDYTDFVASHPAYRDAVPAVHTTINSAIAVAGDFDAVIVMPGQYVETATINITQAGLKLMASYIGPNKALIRTEIRQHGNSTADLPCITCNVHGVEIAGFRITPYSSNAGTGILLASAANTYGTYIHDNYFYCVEVGAAMANAITMGVDDSFDADSTYISNNHFFAGGSATSVGCADDIGIIDWNSATRSVIEGNTFFQYTNWADNYAIQIYDADGFRGQILDNRFYAAEIGVTEKVCVAIKNPTAVGGDLIIDGNSFVGYLGDAQCIASALNHVLGINYRNEHVVAGDS